VARKNSALAQVALPRNRDEGQPVSFSSVLSAINEDWRQISVGIRWTRHDAGRAPRRLGRCGRRREMASHQCIRVFLV
jgi:hypothetical protein